MPRLLFEKTGNAVWISHLDLMRLFQRAFKRAGLPLVHSKGFNPRPSVSIALPLSVGIGSSCELLDFELEGEKVANDLILEKLNEALIPGIKVLRVYDDGLKIKHLSLLECDVVFEFDDGVPEHAPERIRQLFAGESLLVDKNGKNGPVQQDIIPMIRRLDVSVADINTVKLHALVCCQNPTLNPMMLGIAVERYLPEMKPNHTSVYRVEIYDAEERQFR